ncbi:MAG: cell wall-binding repeat-containing protein [Coriobacteriia bacterium]|nr:cell wall-binding repeat-containing protein [Coriobacteriia bacterium]
MLDVQTAVFAPDMYEPDDTFATAYEYDPAVDGNTFHSVRTFAGVNLYGEDVDDQVDYVAVTVEDTGTPIWVETMYLDGRWDSYVYIYAEDAVDEDDYLDSYDDNDFFTSTYSESAYFLAPEPGTYYVGIENRGYTAKYELFITVGDARRVAGANRYATAAAVSRLQWDNTNNPYYGTGYGPEYIVVANGINPADALTGGALAAQLGGVLLLTDQNMLPAETKNEIMRVATSLYWYDDDVTVFVLGGTGAVSDAVFKELQEIQYVNHVERIFGQTRFETAAEIATMTADLGTVIDTAYIVNGFATPDALAVAPVAAWDYAPVLLTAKDDVPDVTMDWLADNAITDVVIVGGEGVVSETAFDELDALYTTTRVAGDNRYETALEVARWGVNEVGMDGALATVVSGESFADALSAAPVSWWTGGPVLLTTNAALHPTVLEYFEDTDAIGSDYNDGIGCFVLGGTGVVSDAAYGALRDLWKDLSIPPL